VSPLQQNISGHAVRTNEQPLAKIGLRARVHRLVRIACSSGSRYPSSVSMQAAPWRPVVRFQYHVGNTASVDGSRTDAWTWTPARASLQSCSEIRHRTNICSRQSFDTDKFASCHLLAVSETNVGRQRGRRFGFPCVNTSCRPPLHGMVIRNTSI
jgi:hypothetical protein